MGLLIKKYRPAHVALLLVMEQLSGVDEDDQAKANAAIEQLLTSQDLQGLIDYRVTT